MNDYSIIQARHRNRTLLVVEGKKEKEQFFRLLLKVFPEIEIEENNIWVYETNIYKLYYQIQQEYGACFDEVDLPFIITKNENRTKVYKRDFSHIYLIFDYECQESSFSAQKIKRLQECFEDPTDNGKLYINYPMLESYLEIKKFPIDDSYINAKIEGVFHSSLYKKRFSKSSLRRLLNFPNKIKTNLENCYHLVDVNEQKRCVDSIMNLGKDYSEELSFIIGRYIPDNSLQQQAYCHFSHQLNTLLEIIESRTYWSYIRWIFQRIVYHNVCKAYKIIHRQDIGLDADIVNIYLNIDLKKVLDVQNKSYLSDKCIWILNTSVFLILDYNLKLLLQDMPTGERYKS